MKKATIYLYFIVFSILFALSSRPVFSSDVGLTVKIPPIKVTQFSEQSITFFVENSSAK